MSEHVTLVIVSAYLVATVAIGVYAYRRTGLTPEDYFLAGRTLGPIVFPLTMLATLMSAYVFLGSAGFSYTHGLGWLAIMSAEVVVAIPLALVGYRAWRIGKAKDIITPTELLEEQFDSAALKLVVLAALLVWAVPYLTIQARGGGIIFESISGGLIPYWAGALLVMAFSGVYLTLGGLRGVAWSDVIQGVIFLVILAAAFTYVLPQQNFARMGEAMASETQLLATSGPTGYFTAPVWLSFLLAVSMSIVSFPQIFQRFFAAKDERSFRALLVWWPVMAAVAIVLPVVLGVWGGYLLPGLDDPDFVIPQLFQAYAPAWIVGIIMGGVLAAMMSTADSLTLTLSSMVTRDVYRAHLDPSASNSRETAVGRVVVVALLAAGYGLALVQPNTIIELAIYFIQGNALLLPVFLVALYWPNPNAPAAIVAVVAGQGYYLASLFGPAPAFGFLPFMPALVVVCVVLAAGRLRSHGFHALWAGESQ